jgi:transposase-like protein
MSKNKVQFQKGMSLPDFMKAYGTEGQCREMVFRSLWPNGFRCPDCGHDKYCEIRSRPCFQCRRCHRQASLFSGTIYEQTKLPLTTWFLASYLLAQNKGGISALDLSRQLGVSYNTAWSVKHKLMQVMLERERNQPLPGRVELDGAYWGGARHGGKRGRGSENKTPFVAAVAATETGQPVRMKMHRVKGLRKKEIKNWSLQQLKKDSHVVTDGLRAFKGLDAAGIGHEAIVTGGGHKSMGVVAFCWVNTVLGNVKTAMQGTYHAVRPKHLPRYLAEFEYRFNRRFKLEALVTRLVHASALTPPMPGRLLKLAEAYW